MLRVRLHVWVLALGVAVSGCVPAEEQETDAKVPGELLGVFAASGRIQLDQCGAELLGAQNPWRFPVKLSRRERVVYWLNGREAIAGDLAADGAAFRFDTRVDTVLSPARGGSGGCSVQRRDRLDGTLQGEDDAVTGFEAVLSYHYSAKNGSDCAEFIGIPGGVTTLPCELRYAVSALASQ